MTARASVPGFGSFAVRHREEYGGVITFERSHPEVPSGVAHVVFKRTFFGDQIAGEAMRLAYRGLSGASALAELE